MREQHDLDHIAALAPTPDIRLIATDMDGTLVDDDKQIHDEFWPLIDELHARGITFCPASGRQYYNLRHRFADIADVDEVVFLAENGSFVVRGGQELYSDTLALDVAHSLARDVRAIPETGAVLCGKRSAYIERNDPPFREQVDQYYERLQVVDDLTAVVDDDILKVAVYDFVSAEHQTAVALAGYRSSHQVVVSGEHWVDIMSMTANKGAAIRRVQESLGIGPDQTAVFGDFLNDLEMLDAATYSFAMSNAHPEVIERANYMAPANTANGVVRSIRALLKLG